MPVRTKNYQDSLSEVSTRQQFMSTADVLERYPSGPRVAQTMLQGHDDVD